MSNNDTRQRDQRQDPAKARHKDEPSAEEQETANRVLAARHRRWVQRKSAGGGAARAAAIPTGGGAPLGSDVRSSMESQLGADLGGVKVHTGSDSAQAASHLGARAFTVDGEVHFGAGQFAPGSKEGDRLLAHELTHVVQGQKAGIQRKADDGEGGGDAHSGESAEEHAAHGGGGEEHDVSSPDDPAEKEADAVGDSVADSMHGGGDKSAGGGGGKPAIGASPAKIGRKIHRAPAKGAAAKPPAAAGGAAAPPPGGSAAADKSPEEKAAEQTCQQALTQLAVGVDDPGLPALVKKLEPIIADLATKFAAGGATAAPTVAPPAAGGAAAPKKAPAAAAPAKGGAPAAPGKSGPNEVVLQARAQLDKQKTALDQRAGEVLGQAAKALGALPDDKPTSWAAAKTLLADPVTQRWMKEFPQHAQAAVLKAAEPKKLGAIQAKHDQLVAQTKDALAAVPADAPDADAKAKAIVDGLTPWMGQGIAGGGGEAEVKAGLAAKQHQIKDAAEKKAAEEKAKAQAKGEKADGKGKDKGKDAGDGKGAHADAKPGDAKAPAADANAAAPAGAKAPHADAKPADAKPADAKPADAKPADANAAAAAPKAAAPADAKAPHADAKPAEAKPADAKPAAANAAAPAAAKPAAPADGKAAPTDGKAPDGKPGDAHAEEAPAAPIIKPLVMGGAAHTIVADPTKANIELHSVGGALVNGVRKLVKWAKDRRAQAAKDQPAPEMPGVESIEGQATEADGLNKKAELKTGGDAAARTQTTSALDKLLNGVAAVVAALGNALGVKDPNDDKAAPPKAKPGPAPGQPDAPGGAGAVAPPTGQQGQAAPHDHPAGPADGGKVEGAKPEGAKPDGAKPDGAKVDGAKPDGPGGAPPKKPEPALAGNAAPPAPQGDQKPGAGKADDGAKPPLAAGGNAAPPSPSPAGPAGGKEVPPKEAAPKEAAAKVNPAAAPAGEKKDTPQGAGSAATVARDLADFEEAMRPGPFIVEREKFWRPKIETLLTQVSGDPAARQLVEAAKQKLGKAVAESAAELDKVLLTSRTKLTTLKDKCTPKPGAEKDPKFSGKDARGDFGKANNFEVQQWLQNWAVGEKAAVVKDHLAFTAEVDSAVKALEGDSAGGAAAPPDEKKKGWTPEGVDPLQDPGSTIRAFLNAGKDWGAVKAAYGTDEPRMTAMFQFRRGVVDTLLKDVCDKHKVVSESNGSANLTSDYDLSLSDKTGKGDVAKAVQEFNSRFRSMWGRESGTVFDTNIYDKGEALQSAAARSKQPKEGEKPDPLTEVQKDPKAQEGNDRVQDVSAMVKVRKHMSDTEWKSYKTQLIDTAPEAKRPELTERVKDAEQQYKVAQARLREEIQKLGANPDAKPDPDIVLQASNEAYAKQLMEVQKLRVVRRQTLAAYQANPSDPTLKDNVINAELALKKAMAVSLDFANEAYNSEGALIDVVGIEQKALGGAGVDPSSVKLRTQEMLSSFNEQFGDALKDLNHGAHPSPEEAAAEAKDEQAAKNGQQSRFVKTMVHVSKYVRRLCKSARDLCGLMADPKATAMTEQIGTLDSMCADLKPLRDSDKTFEAKKEQVPGMINKPTDKPRPDAKDAKDKKGAINPQDYGVKVESIEVFKGLLLKLNLDINQVARAQPEIGKPQAGGEKVV